MPRTKPSRTPKRRADTLTKCRISLRNLRHIAVELGENIDEEELRAMIDEFDLDGDGESILFASLTFVVNEQEFLAIMIEADA